MSSRITIYDNGGHYLTEIDASFNRGWKLDDYVKGSFNIVTSDPKCTERYLEFGNLVLVEHEKLPPWAGMIDTPREWGHGLITVNCYSAEYLLTTRITKKPQAAQGPYGLVFDRLLSELWNDPGYNVVRSGSIYGGGPAIARSYNYANLYDEILKLSAESGNDFDLTHAFDNNGLLYFNANWYERKGEDLDYKLYQDRDVQLSTRPLREQGKISNRIRIYGDGATFNTRPVAARNDDASAAKYGIRYLSEPASGVTVDQLNDIADQKLKVKAYPRRTYDLTVLDVETHSGNPFRLCRVGNTLPVSFYSVGFYGSGLGTEDRIRILEMTYNEDANTLKIIADERED